MQRRIIRSAVVVALTAAIVFLSVLFGWSRIVEVAAQSKAWLYHRQAAGAAVTAAAAVTVFLVTQAIVLAFRWRDRRIIQKRLVIGLYAEIDSNLREIREFADQKQFYLLVRARVGRSDHRRVPTKPANEPLFRPLIVVTESSRFFSASASLIPEIRTDALLPLMEFYRLIEELEERRAAFETKAFETISPSGRQGTVDDLWYSATRAADVGSHALTKLKEEYPSRWFRELAQAEANMPPPPPRDGLG